MVERLVDQVLDRESELVSCLTTAQQEELTALLRSLLDGLHGQLGERGVTHVGDAP